MSLVFKGRLAISGPRKIEGQPLEKYLIGGALLTLEGQPVTKSGGWEMMECEVIIKPIVHHREIKDSLKTARLDQVVQSLSDDSAWLQRELPPLSLYDELMS